MKKISVIAITVSIFLFILYYINEDIKAIKNAKLEIYDAKVKDFSIIHAYILLNLSMIIINNESHGINDLEGNFDIYILNVSIGKIGFDKIDVPPHSSKNLSMEIKIFYEELAKSILEALKQLNIKITLKGYIKGKIFFSLLEYKKPIEATYLKA